MDPNTFPTKGNLILAKNSLALAKQGYELMDKKRNILIKELMDLIEQLNARANLVLWEREHPDFEEHAAFVKEKNPRFYEEAVNG